MYTDRSITETGHYVYRIVAKLPGVEMSVASDPSEEIYVFVHGSGANESVDDGSAQRLEIGLKQSLRLKTSPSQEYSDGESSESLSVSSSSIPSGAMERKPRKKSLLKKEKSKFLLDVADSEDGSSSATTAIGGASERKRVSFSGIEVSVKEFDADEDHEDDSVNAEFVYDGKGKPDTDKALAGGASA